MFVSFLIFVIWAMLSLLTVAGSLPKVLNYFGPREICVNAASPSMITGISELFIESIQNSWPRYRFMVPSSWNGIRAWPDCNVKCHASANAGFRQHRLQQWQQTATYNWWQHYQWLSRSRNSWHRWLTQLYAQRSKRGLHPVFFQLGRLH